MVTSLKKVIRAHPEQAHRHPTYVWLSHNYPKIIGEGDEMWLARLTLDGVDAYPYRSDTTCINCNYGICDHPHGIRENVIFAGEPKFQGHHELDKVYWESPGKGRVYGYIKTCNEHGAVCVDAEGVSHKVSDLTGATCGHFTPGRMTEDGQSHPTCTRCLAGYRTTLEDIKTLAMEHLRLTGVGDTPVATTKVGRNVSTKEYKRISEQIMDRTVFRCIPACPRTPGVTDSDTENAIKALVKCDFKVSELNKIKKQLPGHAERVCVRFREVSQCLMNGARFSNTVSASGTTYGLEHQEPFLYLKIYS